MIHNFLPRRFIFSGVDMRILSSSTDNGGQFSLIQGIVPPGGGGVLHVHAFEDETMHLLEGELDVTIGGETFALRAGETYFAPRNVPHGLYNRTDRPARGLVVTTPGGFDSFIAQAGIPLSDTDDVPVGKPPTEAEMGHLLMLAKDFGITILEGPARPG